MSTLFEFPAGKQVNNSSSNLPSVLRTTIDRTLNLPMPRGRGQLTNREPLRHLDCPEVDGRAHIVFVGYYPTPAIAKKSYILRATETAFTTFIGCCIREDADITNWFDQAYEVNHYRELYTLLQGCGAHTVSVFSPPSILGAIAIAVLKGVRIIIDINDAALFLESDNHDAALLLEQTILAHTDGITHKMPPEAVAEMRKAYDFQKPDYLIHSLPLKNIIANSPEHIYKKPYRLVLAEGIIPFEIARQQGHGHHILDPIILQTAGQDITLDFFVNQNARDMHWDEHQHYFNLEQKFHHFKFRKGVPFFSLPQAISSYHFGLLYDNVSQSTYPAEHFEFNMSTKIFSYIEAELPILVHDKFNYICNFIREHGLGIIYSIDNLEEIPSLLSDADYHELKNNVLTFRSSHHMTTNINELKKAYGLAP